MPVRNIKTFSDSVKKSEFQKRYLAELAKRPEVSDEEFMAETEVDDEQYAMGMVLPNSRVGARSKTD